MSLRVLSIVVRFKVESRVFVARELPLLDEVEGDLIRREYACDSAEFLARNLSALDVWMDLMGVLTASYGSHVANNKPRIRREIFRPWPCEFNDSVRCNGVPLQLLQDVENRVLSANSRLQFPGQANIN